MSSNRLTYDDCAQINQNKTNKDQLNWVLDNSRFENSNNCMIDLGVNGGNTATNNKIGDRVGIESKLYLGMTNDSNGRKIPHAWLVDFEYGFHYTVEYKEKESNILLYF